MGQYRYINRVSVSSEAKLLKRVVCANTIQNQILVTEARLQMMDQFSHHFHIYYLEVTVLMSLIISNIRDLYYQSKRMRDLLSTLQHISKASNQDFIL